MEHERAVIKIGKKHYTPVFPASEHVSNCSEAAFAAIRRRRWLICLATLLAMPPHLFAASLTGSFGSHDPSRMTNCDQPAEKAPWHLVKPDLSLGTVKMNHPAQVIFKVVNDTGKPIKIVSATGECRCTSLVSAPEEIPPHGTATIQFQFSPDRVEGDVTKSVMIEADNGDTLEGSFSAIVK